MWSRDLERTLSDIASLEQGVARTRQGLAEELTVLASYKKQLAMLWFPPGSEVVIVGRAGSGDVGNIPYTVESWDADEHEDGEPVVLLKQGPQWGVTMSLAEFRESLLECKPPERATTNSA